MENLKNKKIILAAVLLIFSIALGAAFYAKKNDNLASDRQPEKTDSASNISDSLVNTGAEAETGRKATSSNEIYQNALDTGDASKCGAMATGEERDLCVRFLAAKLKDREVCQGIKSAGILEQCRDYIVYNDAIAKKDYKSCPAIASERLKTACFSNIITAISITSAAECDKYEDNLKNICLDDFNLAKAMETNDLNYCGKISTAPGREECYGDIFLKFDNEAVCTKYDLEIRSICLDAIKANIETAELRATFPPDSDNDGLSDSQEVLYGTDPKKYDTDNDGFGDGEEVRKGFNPKGPGKLESFQD